MVQSQPPVPCQLCILQNRSVQMDQNPPQNKDLDFYFEIMLLVFDKYETETFSFHVDQSGVLLTSDLRLLLLERLPARHHHQRQ